MLYKQFGDKDGLIKVKDIAKYVSQWDPDSASYFWTDFKLTKDFFVKTVKAFVEE